MVVQQRAEILYLKCWFWESESRTTADK